MVDLRNFLYLFRCVEPILQMISILFDVVWLHIEGTSRMSSLQSEVLGPFFESKE